MRLSLFVAIMMLLAVTAKRMHVSHADLNSILSEYAGNTMLNQATGGDAWIQSTIIEYGGLKNDGR
jgi:hypothetical protein